MVMIEREAIIIPIPKLKEVEAKEVDRYVKLSKTI